MHAIRTNTDRKSCCQHLCHFSPSITAQVHKHCTGIPEFKNDALCPILDQCTACIQLKLKKVSPGKEGTNPDDVQLPHQCLSINFAFADLLSVDKTHLQGVEGINGETCRLMIQDKFGKMVHCDVRISKAPPVQFIDDFLMTCAPAERPHRNLSCQTEEGNSVAHHKC